MFSKMHPDSMSDFDIIEKNSMQLAGRKKNIKILPSNIFLLSMMFFKKTMSKKLSSFQKLK